MKKVSEVDWNNPHIHRAGIIPFIVANGQIFYCFSVQSRVRDLADFGGHKELIDRDLLDSAIREYHEECLSIFGKINRSNLSDMLVFEGDDTLEILFPVENKLQKYRNSFNTIANNIKDLEVCDIVWISEPQLIKILSQKGCPTITIYDKIASCFKKYMLQ